MTREALPVCTVLAVDDCEDNLDLLASLLASDTIQLLLVPSAAKALALLQIHDVALALLDVHMPEMDGYELAASMRADPLTRHVPIVFLTAGAVDRSAEFRAYDAGPVEFLRKPLDAAILRQKTRDYTAKHGRISVPS